VKDENGDLLADSHNILNRLEYYFTQFFNVHRVSNMKLIEIHRAEQRTPDPSPFEARIPIANLKRNKSPGSDQVPAELIQVGSEKLRSEIRKLINSILNKEELPDQWKEPIIVLIYRMGDKTYCTNYSGISLLSPSYKILSNILHIDIYIEI
jgi:hypothetical protein